MNCKKITPFSLLLIVNITFKVNWQDFLKTTRNPLKMTEKNKNYTIKIIIIENIK